MIRWFVCVVEKLWVVGRDFSRLWVVNSLTLGRVVDRVLSRPGSWGSWQSRLWYVYWDEYFLDLGWCWVEDGTYLDRCLGQENSDGGSCGGTSVYVVWVKFFLSVEHEILDHRVSLGRALGENPDMCS